MWRDAWHSCILLSLRYAWIRCSLVTFHWNITRLCVSQKLNDFAFEVSSTLRSRRSYVSHQFSDFAFEVSSLLRWRFTYDLGTIYVFFSSLIVPRENSEILKVNSEITFEKAPKTQIAWRALPDWNWRWSLCETFCAKKIEKHVLQLMLLSTITSFVVPQNYENIFSFLPTTGTLFGVAGSATLQP